LCGTGFAAIALALCGSSAALAQTVTSNAVETVVVTGSRLAVASPYDAPTPVTAISSEDIQLSGTLNIETLLNDSPQFVGAENGSPSSNTQQANGNSGGAYANLRGLNGTYTPRSLVLVNGRRFTVSSTALFTDLNTIPAALIERTEIVTGGSSAVYGSDAIAGVINFIMKQNFTGAEVDSHVGFDSDTTTPDYSFDVTVGSNFDHDRGNVAVSMDYLNRGGIQQKQVSYAALPINESCVTTASYSKTLPGTANGASAANCASSGGIMGFTQGGSTSTPDGQFIPTFTGSDPTLNALETAAGITPGQSFTFNDAGTTVRAVNNPADEYNTTALNNMQLPQERWMINSFAHYDITPNITAYAEMHFSNNTVGVQLTPSNLGGQSMWFNVNNPYLSPAMQAVLGQLAVDEGASGPASITEGSKTFTCTPGTAPSACTSGYSAAGAGNMVILKISRRFVELGDRTDTDGRIAWRFAGGFKGDIGSLSDDFFKDLSYDIYYDYAKTIDTDWLSGVGSRSAIQNSVLEGAGGAAPVCDIFGLTMSPACVAAVAITDSYTTKTEEAGSVASLKGTVVDLPAGPLAFDVGAEWRYEFAQYLPDPYLQSGEPTGFNGSLPTKGSETAKEVFGEIRVPVLADLPLVKSFTVNSAFRDSCYNLTGVGCVWTYSGGGDWKVTDDIAFRGQFQHAIRAPNVGELYGGTALNFASSAIDPCGVNEPVAKRTAALQAACVATGVPSSNVWTSVVQDQSMLLAYQTGGNANLSAEASDTITLGTVLTPSFIPGLQASVDYYSIDIKGAIASFGGTAVAVLNGCYTQATFSATNIDCQAFHRDQFGAIGASNPVNLGETNLNFLKVEGVDIDGDYTFDPGWSFVSGDSTVTVSTEWTRAMENKSQTPGNAAGNCLGYFGQTCAEPEPRWKGVSRVTYHDGPLTVSLRWRFIDSVVDDRTAPAPIGSSMPLNQITNPVIPDYNYFDLSGSYDVNDNLTFTIGVNNLFNLTPPVQAKSSYGNTWPETYDAFGQTFFVNLTAKTD
jgi:outer membrane receptor protein involved in Fe transport